MPYFFYYLLKVILCSAVLFGYYHLFLRNKVYHAYNRFYLLAATVISLAVPFLNFNVLFNDTDTPANTLRLLQVVNNSDEYLEGIIVYSNRNNISTNQVLLLLYALVSVIMLIVLVRVLIQIFHILKTNSSRYLNDVVFVESNAKGTPFSFFKFIFWNKAIDLHTPTGQQIFAHELAHVREKHSADKLYINFLLIVFWINPIFWLIKKELTLIHEFVADKKAVAGNDARALAAMIVQSAYPQHSYLLGSHFFYSPIKRRLKMLTKYNNKKAGYLYRVLALPVILVLIAALTIKAKPGISKISDTGTAITAAAYYTEIEPVYRDTVPHDLGTYKGEKIEGIRVKPRAKANEVEILLSNGKRFTMTPEEAERAGIELPTPPPPPAPPASPSAPGVPPTPPPPPPPPSLASIRVTGTNNYWTADSAVVLRGKGSDPALISPVWVLNGTVISDFELKSLKPDNIQSIKVLKGANAAKYGGAASLNGAVEINTKTSLNEVVVEGRQRNTFSTAAINEVVVEERKRNTDGLAEVVVEGRRKNYLYVGVNNIINIPDAPEGLKLSIGNGRISQSSGQWIAQVYSPCETTVLVTDANGKNIGSYIFDVRFLPDNFKGSLTNTINPFQDDKVFTKVEVEPEFPGGVEAWKKYLSTNVNPSMPVDEGWKEGKYMVIVQFVVGRDGSIYDVVTENYKGTKTARMCIDLIKKGPKWKPAIQNGRKVTAYRKQPITFVVEEQKG